MATRLVALELTPLRGFPRVRCPCCEGWLSLHLPDPMTPDRLLGTCEGCHAWFLIDAERGQMARLPASLPVADGDIAQG